jgi:RHS repeat-associated protein
VPRARRRIKPYLAVLETLEQRSLFSVQGRQVLPVFAAPLPPRHDLDALAAEWAYHPGLAARAGLGGLAQMLDSQTSLARVSGWGAVLAYDLETHPRYTAYYHLTSLLTPPVAATKAAPPKPKPVASSQPVTPSKPVTPSQPATPSVTSKPTPTGPTTTVVAAATPTTEVGQALITSVLPGGLAGAGVVYTITPQPLPAGMSFNRQTGKLRFDPAPGEAGTYAFTVTATNGAQTIVEPVRITVAQQQTATTELSGAVVDEAGRPLAGIPVTLGTATVTTNAQGNFTLMGLPANPGPLSAGGAVGQSEGRLDLTAPVLQLLGHDPYSNLNNVLPAPVILPKIRWSTSSKTVAPQSAAVGTSSSTEGPPATAAPLTVTNSMMPGFSLQVAAAATVSPTSPVKLRVAHLSPKLAAQHLLTGTSGPAFLYQTKGVDLSQPVVLSLPNTTGLLPGATMDLLRFNVQTGGHDVIGQLVVSADGKTLISTSPVVLASGPGQPITHKKADGGGGSLGGGTTHAAGRKAAERASGVSARDNGGGSLGGGVISKAGHVIDSVISPPGTSSYSFSASSSSAFASSSSAGFSTTSSSSSSSSASSGGITGGGGTTGGGAVLGEQRFFNRAADEKEAGCLGVAAKAPAPTQTSNCKGCEVPVTALATPGNTQVMQSGALVGGNPQNRIEQMGSDAGLVDGAYFLDHSTVTYTSQGQDNSIDLQYASDQADPHPVAEFQFTTQVAGDSSSLHAITAQISFAGVVQGLPTTYLTPGGLADGTTYDIPLQVDASALPTGVYPYTMKVTEHFGAGAHRGAVTTFEQGYVNVVNESSDPMGAGWSVGGLQQVSQVTTGGPVLVTAGQQGTERFDPVYDSGQTALQDLALSSSTDDGQMLANDGTGTFAAGTDGVTSSPTVGSVTGDFNGDGKPDLAVAGGTTLALMRNNGAGGFTAGSTYTLPSGDNAKALVAGNFTGHTDGVLDLAVLVLTSYGTGGYDVLVYKGYGDGTFASPVTSAAGGSGAAVTFSTSTPDSMVAGDFNGDGKTDVAFTTDNGIADVMLATSGGSFSTATALALPSGHLATGIVAVDYNADGKLDLVVEANNTNVEEDSIPFVNLDLFEGSGTGSFAYLSTNFTTAHPDAYTIGLVAGDFNGKDGGLEIAVPVSDGGGGLDVDIVPLTVAGTWGSSILRPLGTIGGSAYGNIVAADLNGSGKPSIALTAGGNTVHVLLTDPDSNQFLPAGSFALGAGSGSGIGFGGGSGSGSGGGGSISYDGNAGMLAVAPFAGNAAVAGYRGPTSDPSTLVHNTGGTWTRTYPDGTVLQFNSAGRETSQTDRNGNTTSYAYVASGAAAGALATITDPVGLVTTLTYSSGHLSTITDPASRVTTITVDGNDNLTQIVDPDGAVTGYGYSTPTNHEATTETSPNGATATAHYNSFGQLTSETLFGGTATTSLTSAQSQGLLAPGTRGALATAFQGTVTDPDGRTTTVTFNWMSHPTGEADPTGASTSTRYNSQGFPIAVTDALGRVTDYTYNAAGDVTSITEPYITVPGVGSGSSSGGYTETISYGDPYGIPTAITDFNGNTTTFSLDSHGNVLEEYFPDGTHEIWTYNSAGQVLTDTSPNGATTTYAYDSDGRLTTITYPGSGTPQVKIHYDAAGDVTSMTDELGRTTTYTYDQAGRVLTSQDPVQAAASKDTAYTYDADGNELTVTDALGNVTSYAYDARDELVGMTDAANQGTSHHYVFTEDADGNVVSTADPLGHTTTYSYDQDNRLTGMTDPAGDRTTYTYDADGELTIVNDPNGNAIDYTYDADGNLATESLPIVPLNTGSGTGGGGGSGSGSGAGSGFASGQASLILGVYTFGYDADGNQLTVTDPLSQTTTATYNNLNEQTAVTDALGHTTSYGYDADGNQVTVTDALGHRTTYVYNSRDWLVSETDPSGGGTTTYTYDSAGELTSVTDPDSNVTSYTYNSAGERATETSPTGGVTTFTYDLVGNLTQTVDPDGHTIQYGYDADNRETTEKWVSGGTTLYTMTLTYDAAGRETSVADNSSEYTYGYNSDNELTSVSDAGTTGLPSVTLTYAYDHDGNRTSMDDSLGGLTSYTYNSREELQSITQSGSGVASKMAFFGYDQDGDMVTLSRYSDVTGTTGVIQSVYTYDAANRLTGISDQTHGGTTVASYSYTLDAADRLTQETQTWNSGASNDTTNYTYTNNNQLTGVTHSNTSYATESFSDDSNGNRNSTGYTTGAGNELSTDGTYNYTYDADGNEITKTKISTGVETVYSWDYRNRLTEVQQVVSGVTTVLATYTYDALDRRIGVAEGGTTTWTLYDGTSNDPILDFNGSGTQVARYLNGPTPAGVDAVLARETSSGVAWYLEDRLGSVGDIVDNSGTVLDHIAYSAFGTVLSESSPSNGDRFKYAGLVYDATVGLNFALFRVQDPVTGRWLSQDPSGFNGGDVNLYRYVGNDSTNGNDLSGEAGNSVPPGGLKSGTLTKATRMAALQEMLNMLEQAIQELNSTCNVGAASPLGPPPLNLLTLTYQGYYPILNPTLPAGTTPPLWGGGTYTPWPSGGNTPYPNRDSNGQPATHGSYGGPGSPSVTGKGHPTNIYQAYWSQSFTQQAITLLHEAYHAGGYWASQSGYDYAEYWAGNWMQCIQQTQAWKNFNTAKNVRRFRAL